MIPNAQAALPLDWDFSLFPNPASAAVNVMLPSDDVAKEVSIYDLSGKRISTLNSNGVTLLHITTEAFSKGVYCIRVSDQNATRMKTLVIH